MITRPASVLSFVALLILACGIAFSTVSAGGNSQADRRLFSLRLVGTAVGTRPALSVAVIEDRAAGTQSFFREGDQIGQLRIEKIEAGYVVIRTDSGLIKLGAGSSWSAAYQYFGINYQVASIDKQEVASAVSEYEQLVQEIRVRPRLEEGRPAGFLIYNIAPGSVFQRMGLENGDVISALNGRPLETSTPVAEFYTALKEGGLLTLDVKRLEGSRTLHLAIH